MLITNFVNSSVEISVVAHPVVKCSEAHPSSVKHRAACFHAFHFIRGQFELLKVQGFHHDSFPEESSCIWLLLF